MSVPRDFQRLTEEGWDEDDGFGGGCIATLSLAPHVGVVEEAFFALCAGGAVSLRVGADGSSEVLSESAAEHGAHPVG